MVSLYTHRHALLLLVLVRPPHALISWIFVTTAWSRLLGVSVTTIVMYLPFMLAE